MTDAIIQSGYPASNDWLNRQWTSTRMFPFFAPSLGMAMTGAVVFGTLSVAHAWLAWRNKTLVMIMSVYAGLGVLPSVYHTPEVIADP